MHRRELLIGAGALAAASLLWKELLAAPAPPADTSRLLNVLCDLVIPDTATPGARHAGVPAFLTLALQHHLAGASNDDLTTLRNLLDERSGGNFVGRPPAQQH